MIETKKSQNKLNSEYRTKKKCAEDFLALLGAEKNSKLHSRNVFVQKEKSITVNSTV